MRPSKTPKVPKGVKPPNPSTPNPNSNGTQTRTKGGETKDKGTEGVYPCVNDLQRVYKIKGKDGKYPVCLPNCRYIHHDQLPSGTTKKKTMGAVKMIAKGKLTDAIVASLNAAIAQDPSLIN